MSIAADANRLHAFAEAFRVLSDAMPSRATSRQALAILRVMAANASGQSVTMSDLRDFTADDADKASIGVSIARSFGVFFEPSARNPEGLGWVIQEADTQDGRVKYLRLTRRGEEIARKLARQLPGIPRRLM